MRSCTFASVRAAWICALLLFTLVPPARAEAEDKTTDPILLRLTAPAQFTALHLSPDGKQIAAIGYSGKYTGLFLIDTTTLATRLLVTPERDFGRLREPWRVAWIANDLLAVDFTTGGARALDLDGNVISGLGQRYIGRLPNVPDTVLAYDDRYRGKIDKVDARSGNKQRYEFPPGGETTRWLWDEAGVLRFVVTQDTAFWTDDTKVTYWYRSNQTSDWQKLDVFPITEDHWVPISVGNDPDSLIVYSRHERDTWALFHYDTRTRRHLDLMAGAETQDIAASFETNTEELLSVTTSGLKPTRIWFSARWAALQKAVDQALPDHINVLSGNPQGKVLVFSYADVDPGRWHVLDTREMMLREVVSSRKDIAPGEMLPMKVLRYPAADGFSIPAYFTQPSSRDSASLPPLVVLIHGGPTVRDDWGWDEEVQALATHGYAVFQPQFRGSSGFGKKFQESGYGQWGLAMQDDITAGVEYLIAQKLVDPARICIYGASYGGYAALWGLAKTPDLYKCGVSLAGVSDIEHMLTDQSDRNYDKEARQFQLSRIGDLATNKQKFDSVSPLKSAARIKAPVLLAHGEFDTRVPISHGQKMRDALRANGKSVEWLTFANGGHGLGKPDRQRFYDALLAFLGKHIGAGVNAMSPAKVDSTASEVHRIER